MFWKTFRWSFILTLLAFVLAFMYGGWQALVLCLVLGILEVSLSFDNAVLNATILRKMSPFWQKMFLTVGIFIAVFGMRLIFPLLIVSIAASIGPIDALQLALQKGDPHQPGTYGYIFASVHPIVAAFGGMFLLLLFLNFIFEERNITWLTKIEKPLAKLGKIPLMAVGVSVIALLLATLPVDEAERTAILTAGLVGIIVFFIVHGLGEAFKRYGEKRAKTSAAVAVGKAGFFLFIYLEVLDATLSFDGAIGAFAITPDPVIIALGLGLIGAMFVRSLTVYMVKKKTLENLVHLEHGAHWAIGALAIILLVSISSHINEFITGSIGVAFILAALVSSLAYNKKHSPIKA
ncbi:MAG: DUF475 domain-containing protein [Candidatus Saccharimonadaceae bacterium]